MKKLKLKALDLGAKDVLTREQLKSVSGGLEFGGTCTCPDGVVYTCFNSVQCNELAPSKCGAGQTPSCTYTGSLTF
jgi:hypothetical protein